MARYYNSSTQDCEEYLPEQSQDYLKAYKRYLNKAKDSQKYKNKVKHSEAKVRHFNKGGK